MKNNDTKNKTDKGIVRKRPLKMEVMKKNHIIKFEIKNKEKLSVNSLKLYNYIYMLFQYNREDLKEEKKIKDLVDVGNQYYLCFNQVDLKEALSLKDTSYQKILKTSVEELMTTLVSIKDFTNWEGRRVKELDTCLIDSRIKYEKDFDNKTNLIKILINKDLVNIMLNNEVGNFTKLNNKIVFKLSSSNQIRLYEYAKSYMKFQKFELNLEELNKMFFTNYKTLSQLEQSIISKAMKSITEKTDINIKYTKNKRHRTLIFTVKYKRKILKEEVETKEELNIIESLLNA